MRTPLQSITAAVDVLADDDMAPSHGKVLKRLESASRQLGTQMKDLTDYVKLEAGMLDLRRAPFLLHEIVELAVNDALPFAERKGLTLECSELHISDPLRITQILASLLTNAIKYTKEGGVFVKVHHAPVGDPPMPQCSGAPYVLVVDDNESAQGAFDALLDMLKVEHDTAADADLAMRLLNRRRHDAMLPDIEMPNKNGGMLARELRA